MTLTIIDQLDPDYIAELKAYILSLSQEFSDDTVHYASGLKTLWLNLKHNPLTGKIEQGYLDDRLWNLVQQLYPDADLALIELEQSCFYLRRDVCFAASVAMVLTIGEVIWRQQFAYETRDCTKPVEVAARGKVTLEGKQLPVTTLTIPSGSLIEFNCKNPYVYRGKEPDSIIITMWRLKSEATT
jgi:hypothetical protein